MRECLSNALAAWSEQDYPTALKEYLKNLIMAPEQERLDKYQDQFAKLLAQASAAGVVFDDRNKRLQNEIFPKSPLVLWTMGNLVMANDPFESLSLYGKAASLSGGLDLVNALGSILACRSTIVSTWHISMLNDEERNQKFNMALQMIVTPNSRVIDIGAGTGLLSMFASRYTNERVIGLEGERPMAQLGQRCVEWNGLGQRVIIHPVMSSLYTPNLPPDVVVSETMDAGGLGEKILQIFHDVHTRYKGGDPSHRITFCPSKLIFSVVVIQSDKFWRSRMHRHNCQEFGCDETCFLRQYNTSLLSDHDVLRSVETSYTTIDTEDFDDLIILSDHIQILTTPLDSEQFLVDLKMLNITAGNFRVPITTAGRADAVLMCWRATLAPGIELESVRKGGWDYAAYPLSARTQYAQGDTFFGEWVVNFEQGIAINHIVDPDTTPGEKESMRGPYDEYLFKKDDGTIEMVNNQSLRKFLSPSPSRLSSWLSSRGQDCFFPVTTEGTLQFQYLETACNQRRKGMDLDFDTITSVRAYGCLFKAGHIHSCARHNPKAQQGVDVQLLDEFALSEYREIRGVDSGDGRFEMLSDPLLLIDLDPRRDYEAIVTGEQCQATVLDSSSADGILYWWVLNGEWSNREAGLPLAAFLFNKREEVERGQKLRFNVFLKDSEFIISYGPGMITASEEDAAAAAPTAAPTMQQAAPPTYPAARTTDV